MDTEESTVRAVPLKVALTMAGRIILPVCEIESAIRTVIQMRADEPVIVGKEKVWASIALIPRAFAGDVVPIDAMAVKVEHEKRVAIASGKVVTSINGETAMRARRPWQRYCWS